jgi:predicted metal-dependent peptidase
MKATELVSAARRGLVLDHPFFGVLSLKLDLVESRKVKTFCTDGRKLLFNPEYVANLNRYETLGVVAHEVLHCANGHVWRRGSRDPKVWNQACDYAINPIVLDAGMMLPEGALDGSPYRGMSAEEIYERLMQQQESQPQGNSSGNGAGQTGQPTQDDDSCQGGTGEPAQPDGSECGEVVDCAADQMPEMQADWSASVLGAAKQAEAMGKLPAGMERTVEDIKNPPQDWRSILRRFVQTNARSDYSWRQPNSRYMYAGLYMPALQSETMPPMVIAVDTSGSIDDLTVSQFAKEIGAIADEVQPERVYVIYCDAEIHGVDVFERGEPVVLAPKGYGGTDFRPVFDWIDSEGISPSCLVYLTDMAGIYPDTTPDYPVLWGDTLGAIPAPWGETIRVCCN